MSKLENLKLINLEWLDNRLLYLDSQIAKTIIPEDSPLADISTSTMERIKLMMKKDELLLLKRELKPIEPLIEDAFDAGVNYWASIESNNDVCCQEDVVELIDKQEYLTKDFEI